VIGFWTISYVRGQHQHHRVRTPVRHYVVVSTSVYMAGPVPARATLER
jgi:hypothetical protein